MSCFVLLKYQNVTTKNTKKLLESWHITSRPLYCQLNFKPNFDQRLNAAQTLPSHNRDTLTYRFSINLHHQCPTAAMKPEIDVI